jgi:hypothetical protein
VAIAETGGEPNLDAFRKNAARLRAAAPPEGK